MEGWLFVAVWVLVGLLSGVIVRVVYREPLFALEWIGCLVLGPTPLAVMLARWTTTARF